MKATICGQDCSMHVCLCLSILVYACLYVYTCIISPRDATRHLVHVTGNFNSPNAQTIARAWQGVCHHEIVADGHGHGHGVFILATSSELVVLLPRFMFLQDALLKSISRDRDWRLSRSLLIFRRKISPRVIHHAKVMGSVRLRAAAMSRSRKLFLH